MLNLYFLLGLINAIHVHFGPVLMEISEKEGMD